MRDDGIGGIVSSLVAFDPDVAERDELGRVLGDLNRVSGWVEHAKVRVARRLRELNDAGRSESPANALMDEGRRSGREAKATEERERVCSEYAGFEDALATGAISPDHVDALSRLTRGLTDVERCDLHAVADDLLASAANDWVSEFERKTKQTIDAIKHTHRPDNDVDELDRQREQSHVKRWTDRGSGMKMTLLALDPLRDAAFHIAVDAQLARLRHSDANAKTPFAQLQVEAVVAAVSAGSAARRLPEIIAHVDATSLRHGRHAHTLCETIAGQALPVGTVQRLCCEAVLTAVIVEADGTVRNVAGERRTANRAQRRALAAMHRTCAHPHCAVSFEQCRIHHIVFWSLGGRTLIDNLLPLCETHHHLVHEGGWRVTMTPDRICTWVRPDGTTWWSGPAIDRTRRQPSGAATPTAIAASVDAAEWRQPSLC